MKKLIAILVSAVLLVTSVLSASMFTVSADGAVYSTAVLPTNVTSQLSLVDNTANIPFGSLISIPGGTSGYKTFDFDDMAQGDGLVFYIENDTGLPFFPYLYMYDTSGNDYLTYVGPWYRLGEDDTEWISTAKCAPGGCCPVPAGFKGYVFIPMDGTSLSNSGQAGDALTGITWASGKFWFEGSEGTYNSYVPAGKSAVISAPMTVTDLVGEYPSVTGVTVGGVSYDWFAPEEVVVLEDTVKMPEYVDDFGVRVEAPAEMENIPKAMLDYSEALDATLIKNNTGLPFPSLYKISGGTTDRIETNRVALGVQGNSCAGYSGFMFYIEVPEMEEYTYEYIKTAAVVDPDTKEVITPAETTTATSSKFHMSLRADIFDTSDGKKEQFYIYAGNMSIWTLATDGVAWVDNSMNGYGMTFDSGFKGFVYVPFTNLMQTGYIAEDDIFLGYSILELTASNDYYQESQAKTPLHGYIPDGKSLVLSAPVQVVGAMDTNVTGDVDDNGKDIINGADNILPAKDVVIIGGEKYSYKRGKLVDYSAIEYPSVTSAFTAVNDFSSVQNETYNISSITPLLPESTYSHYRATSRALATGDTMENATYNSYYLFGQNIALSFSGGWVVYVDFSEMTKTDGTGAEEMFTAWVRGAKEDGSSAAAAGIIYASANDKTAPYYYLAEGANAWVSKTLIDNDTATATYGSTEASDSLILPDGFKGYVYFPNKLMRTNMTYSSGKYFKSMSFTVFDTDSVGKKYKISAPIYVSTFDSTTIYAKGTDSQLVNLSTNTLVDPVVTYNDADKFPYNKDLVEIIGDVTALTTLTDATRDAKNTISASATFNEYAGNGYEAEIVKNNTVFKDSLVRVTGSETSTQSAADMVEMYFTSMAAADYDGYMVYLRNDSETTLRLAFQPYGRKAEGGTDYGQVSAALPFLTQVDGKWQWTTKTRVTTSTYEVAPGEGGYFYFSIEALRSQASYDFMKIRTSASASYPTTDVNFVASVPIAVSGFTQNAAGMAYVNGAEVPQDLYSGDFVAPNDFDKNFTVNLMDLIQAKDEAVATDFDTFRKAYLNTYFNDAEYSVLSATFSFASLAYSADDTTTILSENPDRGYRSELFVQFASAPLTVSETPDYTVNVGGSNYTVTVEGNTIRGDKGEVDESVVDTDYNITNYDMTPLGVGSGGVIHTVPAAAAKAYAIENNLAYATEDNLAAAAVKMVDNYMQYDYRPYDYLNPTEEAGMTNIDVAELVRPVYDYEDEYATMSGSINGSRYGSYKFASTREYDSETGELTEIKLLVNHGRRTIFASDSETEWRARWTHMFDDIYKIGADKKSSFTDNYGNVTYNNSVTNNIFNAYLQFTEFAHKDELAEGVLTALDFFFDFCREREVKCCFRPAYNADYTNNAYLSQTVANYVQFRNNVASQCADEETMIAHIKQMAPVIAENKDVIHKISSGWIGFGGEMAAGYQYPPVSYKNVITAILENHCIPNGLYFSSRSSTYYTNIINGIKGDANYNNGLGYGNLDILNGLTADAEWAEKYAKWCGFNNDAFFGAQNFSGWGSGAGVNQPGLEEWENDTANAAYAPNDGELYTNGSHVYNITIDENGVYHWIAYDDLFTDDVEETDNKIPTPIEAIRELAHHRYTDLSQWHGFLEKVNNKTTTTVMELWMDYDAEWVFESKEYTQTKTINGVKQTKTALVYPDSVGNGGYFNAAERAAEITGPITKQMLDANGIVYDPAYFANTDSVSAYEFIRDHLGYRLVAQNASIDYDSRKSDKIDVSFNLKNFGFAAAFNMESSLAILDAAGNVVQEVKVGNPETWYNLAPDYYTVERSSSAMKDVLTHTLSAQFDAIEKKGTYRLAFKLQNTAGTAARLANDVEMTETGYNILGSFAVK